MSPAAEITDMFSLADQVAVVTGAASGLGRESARVMALAGAKLVLADIDTEGLQHTVSMVEQAGSQAFAQPTDVTRRAEVESLADAATARFGHLDIWVNSAGLPMVAPVLDTVDADAQKNIDVNMMGTYWGCAAAARHMQSRRRGAIVNISSGGGDHPVPGLSVYGMTKAAVIQLTRVCAQEFGSLGIRVNAIAPAWIETPMGSVLYRNEHGDIDPVLRDEIRRQQAAANPMGVNGTPTDIAMAILFLVSNAAGFINGQLLHVNGGAY